MRSVVPAMFGIVICYEGYFLKIYHDISEISNRGIEIGVYGLLKKVHGESFSLLTCLSCPWLRLKRLLFKGATVLIGELVVLYIKHVFPAHGSG